MNKKVNIDVSSLNVSKEQLDKVKGNIRNLSDKDIKDLVNKMNRVVKSHNQRKSLLQNIHLVLKIAALVGAVA